MTDHTIGRRTLLMGTAAAALGYGTLRPASTAGVAVPFMPYTTGSFFKSPVAGAPVDAARTTAFKAFMKTHPDQKAINWPKVLVNPSWTTTFHLGKSTDPVWKLTGGNTGTAKLLITKSQGFHMADSVADKFPTGTQDRPGVMVDPVFGYTVQFADAKPNLATRTITVSNAGIMWHASNGLDYRNPKSTSTKNFTSRGRIVDAQVVRPDLVNAAVANGTGLGHVLHLFFVETKTTDGFCHPMTGAEGGKSGWGAEGERIAIRPNVDLAARGLTGGALVIAKTLQQHGGYLGDNSGSSTQIKGATGGYPGTNITADCLKTKVTWDDFVVLPRGWQ